MHPLGVETNTAFHYYKVPVESLAISHILCHDSTLLSKHRQTQKNYAI